MNPYVAPLLQLNVLDRAEWRRYEKANAAAKERYYAHRDHIDDLEQCPACDGLTYAKDGIHALCKRRTKEKP